MTTGRGSRWGTEAAAPMKARVVGSGAGSHLEEMGVTRAQDVATTAARTADMASRRLRAARESRKFEATMALSAGVLGLAGTVMVAMVGPADPMMRGFVLLIGTMLCSPAGASLWRMATSEASSEESAAVALEASRRYGDEASRVVAAVMAAADGRGMSPTIRPLLERLLTSVEAGVGAVAGREDRTRGEGGSRRGVRIKPRKERVIVTLQNGSQLNARIVDVSVTGVAINGNLPGVGIGSVLRVGQRAGRVARAIKGGYGVEFVVPLGGGVLHEDMTL